MQALADVVDAHARSQPDALAYAADGARMTWRDYARRSDRLAQLLVALGLARGDRVAVLLPDGPGVHAAWIGVEKAGLVTVGVGPRAGALEVAHLLRRSGARALVSHATHRDLDFAAILATLAREGKPVGHHVVIDGELADADALRVDGMTIRPAFRAPDPARRLGVDDVFLLNSTSGTTGLPKCVVHDQRRWYEFHALAVEAGSFTREDVFCSVIPAPFGFGVWTSHVTPALLGVPTVVLPRFSPELLLDAIELHGVTVLAAVSTQFVMLLGSDLSRRRLGSLRALFTGGEAVPRARALEFELETGAAVLQFYGSNETGALSRTTLADPQQRRLDSAGRTIDSMHVRLFDEEGRDVTASGRGQPGCRGPLLSRGYWDDPKANEELYTPDGWMLTGDVVEIDADGWLRVVGRRADFIIRGGKNVSAVAVEEAVCGHPDVALAAAVAMPDPVFGERVCVYCEARAGRTPTLDSIVAHLRARGVSPETWPERLIVVDALPRSSGGKIAKGALREDVKRRLAAERAGGERSSPS
jgi:acyl-CoA synthetase